MNVPYAKHDSGSNPKLIAGKADKKVTMVLQSVEKSIEANAKPDL